MAEQDSAQIGKKGKRETRQKWGYREGHTSARPKEDDRPEAFEGIRTKRREEWGKTAKELTKATGTEHALFAKEQNRGTRDTQKNSIIKGGDGYEEGSEKNRKEAQKKEEIL